MRLLQTLAFILCLSIHTLAAAAQEDVNAGLLKLAGLGTSASANCSEPDSNGFVVCVVATAERGKLLIIQKQNLGGYQIEAASQKFEINFGPRYYIEIVQNSGPRRFYIQVNSHSACGIQVETFRIAHASGAWRIAGYDKAEPDSISCDVNFRSREYSANLLTHRINVMEYRNGKVVKRKSRSTKYASPQLAAFNFFLFENEP